MRSIIAALACAVGLAGCDTYGPSLSQLESFAGSEKAMVAISIDGSAFCGKPGGAVWLGRKGSERGTKFLMNGSDPGVQIVEPGMYFPYGVACSGNGYIYDLPNVSAWFSPVELRAGEVVHLGTLVPWAVVVQVDRSDLDVVGDAINTLGTSLFTLGPSKTIQFPVYEFRPITEEDRVLLRKLIGDAANHVVERQPAPVMSPRVMETAYRRAYALKPDGTAPREEEGQAKLESELNKALMEEYMLKEVRPRPLPSAKPHAEDGAATPADRPNK
jgi:hypothetical protein